jgi:hypothetical protein
MILFACTGLVAVPSVALLEDHDYMDAIYLGEKHDDSDEDAQSILECMAVMMINNTRDELSLCLTALSKPKKVLSTFYLVVFLLFACASQGDVVVLRVPWARPL